MTVTIGDMQSVGTRGWWVTDTAGGSAPGTPTLTLTNDGDGDAVTATVAGDGGVTNTLYYRAVGASAWTTGASRSGDGTINQTGLDDNTWYSFVVVSSSGGYNSLPSLPASIYCTSGDTSDTDNVFWGPLELLRTLVAASATFQSWVGATGATEAELIASAKASVYLVGLDDVSGTDYWDTVSSARPFALLDIGEEFEHVRSAHISSFVPSGSLLARFESAVASGDKDDAEAAQKAHVKTVGDILGEMEAKSAEAGYLIINGFSMTDINRTPQDDVKDWGDAFASDWVISWGLERS